MRFAVRGWQVRLDHVGPGKGRSWGLVLFSLTSCVVRSSLFHLRGGSEGTLPGGTRGTWPRVM